MIGQNADDADSPRSMARSRARRRRIAFLNDFWLMMVMTAVAIPLLLLLKPVKSRAAPAVVADH